MCDTAGSDATFKYFATMKRNLINTLTTDRSGILSIKLDYDQECMTAKSGKRLVVQTIRCVNCDHLSRLVADDSKVIGKPFSIETGKHVGETYVIRSLMTDTSTIVSTSTKSGITCIELSPFAHSVILDYMVDHITGINRIIGAWICGRQGHILQKVSCSTNRIVPLDAFKRFKKSIAKLVSSGYTNARVDSTSLDFDTHNDQFVISVVNNKTCGVLSQQDIYIMGISTRKCMSKTGHPADINSFMVTNRLIELVETYSLDIDFASVYTGYALLICLLLTGRWFKHVTSTELADLIGSTGMSVMRNFLKESAAPPNAGDINEVLNYVILSKAKLHSFLKS